MLAELHICTVIELSGVERLPDGATHRVSCPDCVWSWRGRGRGSADGAAFGHFKSSAPPPRPGDHSSDEYTRVAVGPGMRLEPAGPRGCPTR
ncbi:MAG TPA: hypothetical protein VGL60_06550 [Acidimicrobiales bacterium]|jgi:hypothetical protein